MTKLRFKLAEKDFRALVEGKEVVWRSNDDDDPINSVEVKFVLEDIGYSYMMDIIRAAATGGKT